MKNLEFRDLLFHFIFYLFGRIFAQKNENRQYMKQKWEREIQVTMDDKTWRLILNTPFESVNNNILVWFQLKLLHKITGSKEYLN